MINELIISVGLTIVIYIFVIGMLIMWDKENDVKILYMVNGLVWSIAFMGMA